jgi:alpha-beta hydrolase superfamily lysophospholipase
MGVQLMAEATFQGSEGNVFYHLWDPEGDPKRIVQMVHGYAEHGGRYAHVAEELALDGAVVYAEDHIGHGRSIG